MLRFQSSQARIDLAEIINKVAFMGERVLLQRYDKDVVAIVSLLDFQLLERLATESPRVPQAQAEDQLLPLDAVVESSNDAIISKTLEGIIVSWNPAAEKLYGYTKMEVKGRPISILVPHDLPDEMPQLINKIKQGQQVKHYETVRLRKDETKVNVSLTISPIKNLSGEIIGASTIARDITEAKLAEAELKMSQERIRALSAHIQILREEERGKVAKEIQQEFEQSLTALKLDLAWLNKRIPVNRESLNNKIADMIKLVESTSLAMRRMSAELRPKILDDLGLVAAIEWEIKEFQTRTGIQCYLRANPIDITLNTTQSIAIFRILQEILANIFQDTTQVNINLLLDQESNILILQVQTIGKVLTDANSLDLLSIRERTLLLGGTFDIQNLTENETLIVVNIPVSIYLPTNLTADSISLFKRENQAPKISPQLEVITHSKLGKRQLNILIADGHTIVREGLKQILSEIPDVIVSGEAGTNRELLQQLRANHWDALVMDISLPDKNGLDGLKQIKYEFPKLPILILSAEPEELYAIRVLKAGVSGYLNKGSASEQLIEAIQTVAKGGQYFSKAITEKLIFELRTSGELLHNSLSDREFQVLHFIVSGRKLVDIAKELKLSVKTISTYRTKILQKMGMKDNSALVQYAIENNLLT